MRVIRLLLLPFSMVYATAAVVRNSLFDTGVLKKHRFPLPVLLVGNLSVGGTGKTPHVEYLINLLQKKYRLATLSRGYGRKTGGFVIAGKGADASTIGDEPMQYHTRFPNITVSVCENRAQGIQKLLELRDKPQVIIMDDGFQHRSVEPGFKLLLTPYDHLFTRDFTLPAGDLREPAFGYRRADCIIVTKTHENMTVAEKEKVRREIAPLKHQQLFFSGYEYGDAVSFNDAASLSHAQLTAQKIVLFTGIAQPAPLLHFLKKHSASVTHVAFPDHHVFSEKDILKVTTLAGEDSIIVSTEKDFLRIRNTSVEAKLRHMPCYYIPVRVKIDREEEFNKMINDYLQNFNP